LNVLTKRPLDEWLSRIDLIDPTDYNRLVGGKYIDILNIAKTIAKSE